MSQKSEKYARNMERRVARLESRDIERKIDLSVAEHRMNYIQTRSAADYAAASRKARDRVRQAENTARKWRCCTWLAVIALMLCVALCLTIKAKAQTEPPIVADDLAESVGPAQCWEAPDIPETDENAQIEATLLSRATVIPDCTVSHYCICATCCGKTPDDPAYGITKSGRRAAPGVSVAVDPSVIPLGSDVLVDYGDGDIQYYRADDTGSAVKGDHIDLCVATHQEALEAAVKIATVYWIPEE
ncbi:3D domain-containing protein [Oscillibacter ruminantium]|uniref:3D domain-containing protein n=1 Tax=Oscillibacter ruminantium TaxID=1263547 RepID=UPI00030C13B0|nr:3D domain-containing protein [Oscillibacter ruminantium]